MCTLFRKIFGLVLWLSSNHLIAQEVQDIRSIPSPTAANLGLYGEIPVSYYTGTPDISIPLYEIKGKHVNVPITLTYHPSAIRPEIHPGPTGLGWTLQAGGVITRTVLGNSTDECDDRNIMGATRGHLLYANGWMSNNDWKQNAEQGLNESFACRNAVWYQAPYTDSEPDEFQFSFLGLSGKFYFDHFGNIQVQCNRPVQVLFNNEFIRPYNIELEYQSNDSRFHRAIKSFIIIDEYGNRYYFGGKDAIEFSDPISYGRDINDNAIPAKGYYLYATSWFLNKIESTDSSDVIIFNYNRGPFISQLYRSSDIYIISGYNGGGFTSNNLVLGGTLISPVYLTEIIKKNGEIIMFKLSRSHELSYKQNDYQRIFRKSTLDDYMLLDRANSISCPWYNHNDQSYNNKFDYIQWLKIDNILILDGVDNSLRKVLFTYHENPNERLFLEKVSILGSEFSTTLTYAFDYKDRDKLWPYLECVTDHWGFHNGKKYSTNGLLYQQKEPDPSYTDSGILSSIHYPTGGISHFKYELHDYSKIVNTKNRSVIESKNGTAGGLRIKKITTEDLIGEKVSREFFYKPAPSATVSSGVLNIFPSYEYSIIGQDTDGESVSISHIRAYPAIPLTTENDGLFIGYTSVCEQISDKEGYAQYAYTNHDNGYHDVLLENGRWHREIFPKDPHNSRFFERGKLLEKVLYNTKNIPVWKQKTNWERYGSQGESNPRAFHFGGLKVGYDYCSSAAYLHYTYKFLPSKKEETIYDTNGQNAITTTTDYVYNTDNVLQSETTIASDGTRLITKYNYAKNILNRSGVEQSAYQWLVNNHIIGTPIEQLTYKNNQLINASFVRYKTFPSNIRDGEKIYPSELLKLETNYPATNYKENGIDERLKPQLYYDRYDDLGNVLQTRGTSGITISYLWGYNKRYKVAEIAGATYDEVTAAIGGAGVVNAIAIGNMTDEDLRKNMNHLREKLPQAMITTYTHKPLVGMTSQTDPNGITTYYEYDEFNRLKIVRDHEGNILNQYEYHYHQNK
jgi:YD repeat-containing protein